MKRDQFEHTIRAAGAILGATRVLVIGSQAIHASYDGTIPEAQRSIETDIADFEDEDSMKADLIDGSIGELSVFQETFGYYAQGVSIRTAILPEGWKKRLIPYCTPTTNGVTALCLEPHDLWISKAIANRPKDVAFCKALSRRKLVKVGVLFSRLKKVRRLNPKIRTMVEERIQATACP